MTKHTHGGNIYKYKNCIDFSANCNPLGTPQRVKDAIVRSLDTISDYPQVGCDALREAIAEYESCGAVGPGNIICGNGAAEVIFSLCRAVRPKHALLPAPTFAEYEQALRSVDCEIEYFMLSEEHAFHVPEAFIDSLHEELDMVFFCNPNNPTGVLTSRDFLLNVLERCRDLGIWLVLDECFLDFVRETECHTLKSEIAEYQNLFILKAFTKRYAMAGVRLGYGICGNDALLERMTWMTQPWNVSSVAQAAGIAALKETAYVEQGRRIVFEEQQYLCSEMKRLGLKVYEPQANYIFFHGPECLFDDCLEQGILIRDCSNYAGLQKGYFRIAVKLHADNRKLIGALEKIMRKFAD